MKNKSTTGISAVKYFDIVYAHRENRHGLEEHCPLCNENVSKIAIVKLVYTHETCNCGNPDYPHLIEQLWHKECFILSETKNTEIKQ